MAAISSISNGESLSSVRTKLNSVITEINLLDPTDWVDYSATSTIVGWSSYITKKIYYRIIGKQLFVRWYLEGTSNSTSTSFTLPFNNINMAQVMSSFCVNNGAPILGNSFMSENSNICQGLNGGGTPWTASGSKSFAGNLFIQIA